MNIRDDLKYVSTHEWLKQGDDGATVGISDFAQSELTDIVFVELPEIGRQLEPGDEICALESVKAVAYVYAPVAGAIAAVNEKLRKHPELINQDPYGDGGVVRIAPDESGKTAELLDAAAYKQTLETAG